MNRGLWMRGPVIGLVVGAAVGLVMTAIDYGRNPAGIFHDESGVHWNHVLETWISWSVPVALIAIVVSMVVVFWIARTSSSR